MKTNKQVEGFALIEVLLAVVILAIALLAGSRMQILGLNYTQGAMTRSHATMAANDIIDRMRLNPTGVTDGDYDGESTATPPTNPTCASTGCTPTQQADVDLLAWSNFFGANTPLPTGSTGVVSAPDANNIRTVTISWQDFIDGAAGTANARQVVLRVHL